VPNGRAASTMRSVPSPGRGGTTPIGWLLGLPSYFAYQLLGLNSLSSYLLGGLLGGFLVTAWLVLPFPGVPEVWVPMVISASVSYVFFWFVAVREVHAT
jgi:hypothetical protein